MANSTETFDEGTEKGNKSHLDKPWIYIAGPLFSVAEKAFNLNVRSILEPFFHTYLPQKDGILLAEAVANKRDSLILNSLVETVFQGDISAIRRADVLLAILDGRAVDEGTAFEIGFAYAIGKPCYGLQTDPRRLLPQGNNPMISQSLKRVFADLEQLRAWSLEYGVS